MLDVLDLDVSVSKEDYRELMPRLKVGLRELQWEARELGLPVIVVLEGWDGAGIGDAIGHLGKALDPRRLKTHAIFDPTPIERFWPFLHRFWCLTPADGDVAILDRSWNQTPVRGLVDGEMDTLEYRRLYRDINEFERQLSDGGTLLVKFFLHISKKEQKKRFKDYEEDPYERWRVTRERWRKHKRYPRLYAAFDEMLENTSTAEAPWDLVPATQRHYRRVRILQRLSERLTDAIRLRQQQTPSSGPASSASSGASELTPHVPTLLDKVDLTLGLDDEEYMERLRKAQVRLRELLYRCFERRAPVLVLFEGWDAAGKGGSIKRLIAKLDPRSYEVIQVAAPTEDERRHHYLWRFWRDLPKAGHLTIFDRSWYGRLLVERVEGLCSEAEWRRAYREINELERQLADYGMVVAKFWLHISKEEQGRRFKAREESPLKAYKLTEEDRRNRERWDDYRAAVMEMLERTSTTYAPWTLVENENKLWGRVKVLEVLNRAIAARLGEATGKANGQADLAAMSRSEGG